MFEERCVPLSQTKLFISDTCGRYVYAARSLNPRNCHFLPLYNLVLSLISLVLFELQVALIKILQDSHKHYCFTNTLFYCRSTGETKLVKIILGIRAKKYIIYCCKTLKIQRIKQYLFAKQKNLLGKCFMDVRRQCRQVKDYQISKSNFCK